VCVCVNLQHTQAIGSSGRTARGRARDTGWPLTRVAVHTQEKQFDIGVAAHQLGAPAERTHTVYATQCQQESGHSWLGDLVDVVLALRLLAPAAEHH
jgi:hypothetical protein